MKRCAYKGCKSTRKGGCWPSHLMTVALIDGKSYCPAHYAEVGRYDSALAPAPLRRPCELCGEPAYYTHHRLAGGVWLCERHKS